MSRAERFDLERFKHRREPRKPPSRLGPPNLDKLFDRAPLAPPPRSTPPRRSQVASFVIDERDRVLAERPAFPLVVHLAGLVLAPLGIFAQPGQTPVQSQVILILESILPTVSSPPMPTVVLVAKPRLASPPLTRRCSRRHETHAGPDIAAPRPPVLHLQVREILQAPPRIAPPRLHPIQSRLIPEIDASAPPGQSRAAANPSATNPVPRRRRRRLTPV